MQERRSSTRHFVHWDIESDCGQIGGRTINLGRTGCLVRNDKLSFLRIGDQCHINLLVGTKTNRVSARVVSAKSNLSINQVALMFQDQIDVDPTKLDHGNATGADVIGQVRLVKQPGQRTTAGSAP